MLNVSTEELDRLPRAAANSYTKPDVSEDDGDDDWEVRSGAAARCGALAVGAPLLALPLAGP